MSGRALQLRDVLDAQRVIAPYLDPTPVRRYPSLDGVVGVELFVKHENHQPTGAFKVRGGINLVARLGSGQLAAGVYAASTGNHGQSVAYAASLFGVPATVFVPRGANPVKVSSMRSLGATVVEHGVDFDEARERCEKAAAEHGARYIHSGDEPLLIAGVATATLELLEREPSVEVIVVPVGGGSGAAGACIVAKAIDPRIVVIGVQSEAAPAAYRAWRERRPVADEMHTFAEGLQTRVSFELPQRVLAEHLDDFVLVTDDEVRAATLQLIELTRTLVEPAGAAPLAAVLKLRERLAGQRVALLCTGGNISPAQLRELLEWDRSAVDPPPSQIPPHERPLRVRSAPNRLPAQAAAVTPLLLQCRPRSCEGVASASAPRRPGAAASAGPNSDSETSPRSWRQQRAAAWMRHLESFSRTGKRRRSGSPAPRG
jgi:threonine dehydratase